MFSERPSTFPDTVYSWRTKQLSNKGLYLCLHSLIWTEGEFGEFKTVMQTRDTVKGWHNFQEFNSLLGLHNCLKFSQLLLCLDEAM